MQVRGWWVPTATAATLVGLRPDLGLLAEGLAHPRAWVDRAGADSVVAALAGAGLWLVAAWVALGLLAAAGARLPGTAGRLSGRLAGVALPAVVRRVVAGSVGLGVLVAPAVAQAQEHSPRPLPAVAAAATAPPAPLWPTGGSAAAPAPATQWPTSAGPSGPSGPPGPSGGTSAAASPETSSGPPHEPVRARPFGTTVTVHPGDSLWLLAGRRLGSGASDHDIADYWPRIYAANRGVVGPDPNLLRPGQVLHLPEPDPEGSS